MFGVGFTEILAIAVIALIFIGPDDLPKFARNIGRILNDLKRGSDSFVDEFKSATDLKEFKNVESDIKSSLDLTAPPKKPNENDDSAQDPKE